MLVLRTCKANMTGHNNFKWPESGPVEAPDWEPTFKCGHGLHGLPWGVGRSGYLYWSDDAKWLVVEVADGDVLTGQGELIDKCKFPKGNVVFCGDRGGAVEYMMAHGADGSKMVGGISTSGDYGQSTSGDYGRSTSGDYGQSTSGDYGQSTSGYNGQSTSGDNGRSTSGDYGQSTSGNNGRSTSGDYGQSTSGDYGQSTSGDYGQSTSGYNGQSTSGDNGRSTSGYNGHSTSGYHGQSTSGNMGSISIQWWDEKSNRRRIAVGYVGEDGIEANVPYRCDENGKLVKAQGEGK